MPTFRRSIFLFVGLLVVAVGSAGRATALRHKPNWPTTVVLDPKWHVAAPGGVEQVLVSGRYAYIGGDSGSGALINERTGKRVVLAAYRLLLRQRKFCGARRFLGHGDM